MPCSYYSPEEEQAIESLNNKKTIKQLTKQVNSLTALLRKACDYIDGDHLDPNDLVKLREWQEEHQKIDEQRIAQEKKEKEEKARGLRLKKKQLEDKIKNVDKKLAKVWE